MQYLLGRALSRLRGDAIRLPDDNIVSHPKEVGMQFGYTIIYVPDVAASLAFFTRAFGLARRFLHESGT